MPNHKREQSHHRDKNVVPTIKTGTLPPGLYAVTTLHAIGKTPGRALCGAPMATPGHGGGTSEVTLAAVLLLPTGPGQNVTDAGAIGAASATPGEVQVCKGCKVNLDRQAGGRTRRGQQRE